MQVNVNINKKILIAAGGSGGHIFPAVTLARILKQKGVKDILFIGSSKSLDRRIFEREGFRFSVLSDNKLPHKALLPLPLFAFRLFWDIVKTFSIIITYRPGIVIGFGGYVSFPAIFIARMFKIPTLIHEQNAVPGRANTLLFKFADRIAISFEETAKHLGPYLAKATFTGNPIRPEILLHDKGSGTRSMGLDGSKFTILVIGGSQGAHHLNETFVKALWGVDAKMKSGFQVIHITGVKDYEWAVSEYGRLGVEHRVFSFIDRIGEAYGAADLIVTRAGASAIFEIAFMGRPMILVPYPFAMSHQTENAKVFSRIGAAVELNEKTLSPESFKDNIVNLFTDRARLNGLSQSAKKLSVPDASDRLANEVLMLSGKAR